MPAAQPLTMDTDRQLDQLTADNDRRFLALQRRNINVGGKDALRVLHYVQAIAAHLGITDEAEWRYQTALSLELDKIEAQARGAGLVRP